MWLWVASYPVVCSNARVGIPHAGNGQYVSSSRVYPLNGQDEGKTHPCMLPRHPWFEDLLALHKIPVATSASTDDLGIRLVGLVQVTASKLYHNLASLSCEEEFLHEYYGFALDAFTLAVKDVWCLKEPCPVEGHRRAPGAIIQNASPSTGFAYPFAKYDHAQVHQAGCDVCHSLEIMCDSKGVSVAHIPMAYLPQPVADLICKASWTSIMGLARWLHRNKGGASQFRKMLEWPSEAELQHLCSQIQVQKRQLPQNLTPDLLRSWVRMLKTWAPAIYSAGEQRRGEDDIENEDQVQLDTMVHSMNSLADSLDYSCTTSTAKPEREMQLIETLRMAFDLRDRNNLKRVIRRAISIVVPPALQHSIGQRLDTFGATNLAFSKSKISRAQLFLDAAIMMVQRSAFNQNAMVHNWMVDSSPQLGHDLLCIKNVGCPLEDVEQLYLKHAELVSMELQRPVQHDDAEEHESDDVSVEEQQYRARRNTLVQGIHKLLRSHAFPPAGLGCRAASLTHKVSAFCFSVFLETGNVEYLSKAVSETFAFVIDLGVESGIGDYMATHVEAVLPSWLQASLMLQDADDIECDIEQPQPIGPDMAEHAPPDLHLFKSTVIIAGFCHLINNADADVDASMPDWDEYYKQLQLIHKFVGRAQSLRRFHTTCLVGTVYESKSWLFANPVKKVAEWRWGSITACLEQLSDMGDVLRAAWDERKFNGGATSTGDGFDPDAGNRVHEEDRLDVAQLTCVISNPVFWAFTRMCLCLKHITKSMLAWAEGCLCHSHTCNGLSAYARERVLATELDLHMHDAEVRQLNVFRCPMAGMRAPELALGKHMSFFIRLGAQTAVDVFSKVCVGLDATQRAKVIRNYEKGRDQIEHILTSKTDFWMRLPWATAGFAYHNQTEAKCQFRKLSSLYDASPGLDSHHRVTCEFMEGPVRMELDAWAQSEHDLSHYPVALKCVSRWCSVPVAERSGEALHSLVKRGAGYRRASGPYISLKLRWPEQEQRLYFEADYLSRLASALHEVRSVTGVITRLGLTRHPYFHDKSSKACRNKHHAKLARVLYRLDTISQYQRHDLSSKFHTREKDKRKRLIGKLTKRPAQLAKTFDSMLGIAFLEHLQQGCNKRKTCYYSLPRDLFSFNTTGAMQHGNGPGLEVVGLQQFLSTPWPLVDVPALEAPPEPADQQSDDDVEIDVADTEAQLMIDAGKIVARFDADIGDEVALGDRLYFSIVSTA